MLEGFLLISVIIIASNVVFTKQTISLYKVNLRYFNPESANLWSISWCKKHVTSNLLTFNAFVASEFASLGTFCSFVCKHRLSSFTVDNDLQKHVIGFPVSHFNFNVFFF